MGDVDDPLDCTAEDNHEGSTCPAVVPLALNVWPSGMSECWTLIPGLDKNPVLDWLDYQVKEKQDLVELDRHQQLHHCLESKRHR